MTTEVEDIVSKLPALLTEKILITLEKNTTVFYKGDITTHAYLIIKGDLIVQNPHPNGETYFITHMGAGSFMCDLEIISGNLVNTTTLITNAKCKLLKFNADQFLAALKADNEFLFMVSRKMADKMYQESYRLGDDLYKKGADKLKVYLVKCYREKNSNNQLMINSTRQVIANEVGVSIKTINRSIKRLKDQSKLTIIGGKINLDELQYKQLVSELAVSG